MPLRRLLPGLLCLALLGSFPAGRALAQSCQSVPGLTYRTYVDAAGATRELGLDLLLPGGLPGPAPVAVWLHGGGWSSGSRAPVPAAVSDLCTRGYAVASVDYRLAPAARWPAQIQDAKAAVRWLRANAATYGLDPGRFAAWGESAGAHLAAMLGTTGGLDRATIGNATVELEAPGEDLAVSSRVQAVVGWYPATDFLQLRFYPSSSDHDSSRSAESTLIGWPVQDDPERSATASPIAYATADDPPFFLAHGTTDKLYPFNQSELLADALRVAGVAVALRPVPNAGHGGAAFSTAANLQPIHAFLDAELGGSAPRVSVAATHPDATEAGIAGTVTVSRTGSTAAPLTVRWALSGTAKPGADYAAPAPVTIPAGAASATVAVAPIEDALNEGDETAVLAPASDPAYRVEPGAAEAAVTIADDETGAGLPIVSAAASDAKASEAGSDGGAFTLSRSGDTAVDLTVSFILSGTAANGADYGPLPTAVTIPAGQAAATLAVPMLDDDLAEASETAILTLAESAAYVLGAQRTASVAVADADFKTRPTVSVSATDPAAAEPAEAGAFTVSRTGATTAALTVGLAASGTAQGGADYAAPTASVTIPAGADRVVVAIAPVDDLETEPAETVALAVVPSAAVYAGPYAGARVDLADDDVPGLPALAALAVSPAAVIGTQSATGTVTLSAAAPAGGAVVALSSGDPAAATVPASVTVAAGATSATFAVTTKAVPADAAAPLSATYRGVTRTASLAVQAPVLASFTLTPGSFAGGCKTSTGKVTLTGKAPAGGMAVALANTNPVAAVPAAVTVAAGATSYSFTITAPAVAASQTGTVTASLAGVEKSAALTVKPVGLASLTLAPNPVTGPASATGTLALECPAAPGEVTVALSSTSSAARPDVPSLAVPAGSATATFGITTADVTAAVQVTIRADANGTGKSVKLTVDP